MITAYIDGNDELITSGTIEPGDIFPGACCPGHNWEVAAILVDILGFCHNPDCRQKCDCDEGPCYLDGVSIMDADDLAESVIEARNNFIEWYYYEFAAVSADQFNYHCESAHGADFEVCPDPDCQKAFQAEKMVIGQARAWAEVGVR